MGAAAAARLSPSTGAATAARIAGFNGDCGFRTPCVRLIVVGPVDLWAFCFFSAARGSPGAGAPPPAATLLPLAAAALRSPPYWDSLRCCLLPIQIVEIFLRDLPLGNRLARDGDAIGVGSPVAGWSRPTVGWIDGGEEGGIGGSDQASKRSKFLSGTGCELRSSDQISTSLAVSMLWYFIGSDGIRIDDPSYEQETLVGFDFETSCMWSLLNICRRSATSFIVGLSSPLGFRQCMASSASFCSTTITFSSIMSKSNISQCLFWWNIKGKI
uniref:Uncharacterized protein n=1 Tax=Oryza nivara TaxID=4536 RepID=A0A0E0JCF7_ORYNI